MIASIQQFFSLILETALAQRARAFLYLKTIAF